ISRSPSPNRLQRGATPTVPVSLRTTLSQSRLSELVSKFNEDLDSYGLEELREGFFDAIFIPPVRNKFRKRSSLAEESNSILSKNKKNWLKNFSYILQIIFADILELLRDIMQTNNGITLTKSFLAYFASFIICVIPASIHFLGPYCYLAPLSVLLHHSGRTSGSQLEITLTSIIGILFGLGWGSLALFVGSSTELARNNFGAIHAVSILIAVIISSWVRASFIRLHHLLLSFSLAIVFVETVDSAPIVDWRITWNFGIPYLFGILICLIINLAIFPDFSHHSVYENLHGAIEDCKLSLIDCMDGAEGDKELINERIQVRLNKRTINMTEFFRSFCNEITISTFKANEVKLIRNYIQVAISRIRAIPVPTVLFKPLPTESDDGTVKPGSESLYVGKHSSISPITIVKRFFETPTRDVLYAMVHLLESCDSFIAYSCHGKQIVMDKSKNENCEINHKSMFLNSDENTQSLLSTQEVLDIFLFIYYTKQTTKSFIKLSRQLVILSQHRRRWNTNLPYYPIMRALRRSTRQIIHDRGGETASYYYRTKREVDETFVRVYNLNTSKYAPKNGHSNSKGAGKFYVNSAIDHMDFSEKVYQTDSLRYRTWKALHRLQGYESRFSIKASIITLMLCLPAWISNKGDVKTYWYDEYESWWAAIFALLILHPRVGGNFHDLLVRSIWCVMGVIWGGFSFAAGNGNPYVICVFCAIFMIFTIYRYSISHHPRSGLIGCVGFTYVSLGLYLDSQYDQKVGVIQGTWVRGISLLAGLFSVILIDWVLWPFVARHEVRKSMFTILSNISQCYQIVTDRYLYHDEDDDPTELALELSEIREARMRQSLHAFKNLLQMTKHEPSLRGNFEVKPYEQLIDLCEAVFQKIVVARISSTYFKVYEHDKNEDTTKTLMSLRRDSVASVLLIFYILSNGFKSKNKIPRYLPSAVAARNHLYNQIAELEIELLDSDNRSINPNSSSGTPAEEPDQTGSLTRNISFGKINDDVPSSSVKEKGIVWREVHEAAFSKAFTDMTEDLERIVSCSKLILGEE
ncbi:hypothetical protein NADFUDRAFT_4077, partial [Nadsonia fulvescens var. elongata DSM 6958]